MKPKLFVLLSLILFISCTSQNFKPLTDEEKSSIELEITEHLDIIADSWGTMDFSKAFQMSLDSPEFRFIATNGSILSYSEEKQASETLSNYFKAIIDYKYDIDQLIVHSPDIAVATMTYSFKSIGHDDKILNHPNTAVTSIYKRINNHWMCIYWHESGSDPEEVISDN
jgi:hypothetical protein